MSFPTDLWITTITDREGLHLGFAPEDLGEFDCESDLEEIVAILDKRGIRVTLPGVGWKLLRRLARQRPPLIWNLSSGHVGVTREAQLPTMLEMLGLPFIGTSSWTSFVTQDKALAQSLVAEAYVHGLNLPRGFRVRHTGELEDAHAPLSQGRWIVKPNFEGSSRGISRASVHSGFADISTAVATTLTEWGHARVEEYIEGTDISANAGIDTAGRLIPFCPVIRNPAGGVFAADQKTTRYASPTTTLSKARGPALASSVQRIVARLCVVFQFQYYARFDLKLMDDDRIMFLEANATPTFSRTDDFAISAAFAGVDFESLVLNTVRAREP